MGSSEWDGLAMREMGGEGRLFLCDGLGQAGERAGLDGRRGLDRGRGVVPETWIRSLSGPDGLTWRFMIEPLAPLLGIRRLGGGARGLEEHHV